MFYRVYHLPNDVTSRQRMVARVGAAGAGERDRGDLPRLSTSVRRRDPRIRRAGRCPGVVRRNARRRTDGVHWWAV